MQQLKEQLDDTVERHNRGIEIEKEDGFPQELLDRSRIDNIYIERTAVLYEITRAELSGTDDIFELADPSARQYIVPYDNDKYSGYMMIGEDSSETSQGTGSMGLPDAQRISALLADYPDHSGDTVFFIANEDMFLYCFRSGGRSYSIPSYSQYSFYGSYSYDLPLSYSVYPTETVRLWAGRKCCHNIPSSKYALYTDHSTNIDRPEPLTSEQYGRVREWYARHMSDSINLPFNGSIADSHRFVPCDGTASLFLFTEDGTQVNISRCIGAEENGLSVFVYSPDGSSAVFWYADDIWQDNADIISVMNEALSEYMG